MPDIEITVLTADEYETLRECEGVIERGQQTFQEVGEALAQIKHAKLYRATHRTFEAYTQERWGWTANYARRQIEASEVAKSVPMGTILSERVARELKSVPAADRPGLLDKAAQASKGGKVTAAAIREAKAPMARPASFGRPAADFSSDIAEMNAKDAKDNRKKRSGLTEKDQRKAESLFGQLQTVLHRAGLAERLGDHLEAIIRAIKGKA